MTSSSRMTRYSSPSTFTSVPLYLPKRILSPTLTSSGRTSPFSRILPLPTAIDLAADRLLGRRVGDHDAAGGLRFRVEPLDDDAVVERTNLQFFSHCCRLRSLTGCSAVFGKIGGVSTLPSWLLMIGDDRYISRARSARKIGSEPICGCQHGDRPARGRVLSWASGWRVTLHGCGRIAGDG